MVIDYRDKVLSFVRSQGPVLPVHIAKEVRTEILMAGAMLSEMVSKGSLRVSTLKVGGSPLYYIPGQEPMLQKFVGNLNEKDRRAVEMLQQHKVLKDNELDALTRVCLRNVKDFAIPLNVTHNGTSELFWKWQTLTDAEASEVIKGLLTPAPAPAATQQAVFAPREEPAEEQEEIRPEPPKVKPQKPKVAKPKPAVQAPLPDEPLEEKKAPKVAFVHTPTATTQTFLEDPSLNDPFYQQILAFCDKANIKILEHVMVKNQQDYDLIIEVPSPVGSLAFYAKARNKLKLNDADLSAAFVQGQAKRLPAMLITPGELSKKAQELLARELRGVAFTRLA